MENEGFLIPMRGSEGGCYRWYPGASDAFLIPMRGSERTTAHLVVGLPLGS